MSRLGDTYWAQSPHTKNPPHLYFVVGTPKVNGKYYLLVNMTKRKACSDTSCILRTGDHRSVKYESVIQYAEAIRTKPKELQEVVKRGFFTLGPRASMDLIKRIQEGALKSPHFRPEYRWIIEAEISNRAT